MFQFIKQIQKLKDSDVNSYINFLEDGIGNLKGKINTIANARLIEERVKLFIDNLNKDRRSYIEKKKYFGWKNYY